MDTFSLHSYCQIELYDFMTDDAIIQGGIEVWDLWSVMKNWNKDGDDKHCPYRSQMAKD